MKKLIQFFWNSAPIWDQTFPLRWLNNWFEMICIKDLSNVIWIWRKEKWNKNWIMTFHDNREHYSLVHIRKQCPSFPFFPSTFLSISKLTKLFLKHKNQGFNLKLSRTQQSKGIWYGEWKTNSESHSISRYSTQYIFLVIMITKPHIEVCSFFDIA